MVPASFNTSLESLAMSSTGCMPASQWIHIKQASGAFDCVCGTNPAYFNDVCTLVVETADCRRSALS